MLRWLRIAAFFALLALPLLTMEAGPSALTSEKRQGALLPSLWAAGRQFPEQFDAYFRDHFGFRDRLIRWHSVLAIKYLRQSPVPNVIVGGGGRLFFAGYSDGIDIRDFAGRFPLDGQQLDRWLQRQLERRAQYARHGIRYVIVVVPNKQTMYPELVPSQYGPHAAGVFDAWLARVRMHPELEVIDLRPILRAHADDPTYYAADSHWNSNGAFYAAQAIVEQARAWFPSVEPLRSEDYVVTTEPRLGGDLATMVALGDAFDDTRYVYTRAVASGAHLEQATELHRVWQRPATPLPRVLVLGDSFGEELADRLADSFARVHFYYSARGGYKSKLVTDEQPDLVVLVLVERYLPYLAVH